MPTQRIRDVEALSALCREMARLGLLVEIRDARPAVSARLGPGDARVWVTVDSSGQLFTWTDDGQGRHPMEDPAGAAGCVFEYVAAHKGGDGLGTTWA